MITVRRTHLNLLKIALGLMFTAGIYYSMHYRIPWDWEAPGIGKLPTEIVRGFMAEAYGKGAGAKASRDYFLPHEVRKIVAQGMNVVVFHRIGPARGEPAADIIDVFETRNGRIVRRDRFPTRFTAS